VGVERGDGVDVLHLTALISPFVGRIQIPLAQPLEHGFFLLFQHLCQQSTDLTDAAAASQGDACTPEH
jgi:hypothetical protein